MKLKLAMLAAFLALLAGSTVEAHPGRLDKDGCHHVTKDYKYQDGRVLKKDSYHCHVANPSAFDDNLFGLVEKPSPKTKSGGKTK